MLGREYAGMHPRLGSGDGFYYWAFACYAADYLGRRRIGSQAMPVPLTSVARRPKNDWNAEKPQFDATLIISNQLSVYTTYAISFSAASSELISSSAE